MATLSSTGLGSGLDVSGLVSQLVAAERAPVDKRLTNTDAKLTTEFTALSSLKGALASLQGAVNGLKGADSFDLRKTTVADESFFVASATKAAVAGSYRVEVRQLAQSASVGSMGIAEGANGTVGEGTLTIGVGAQSFNITVAADQTLAGIRDAINASTDNPGVRATLITDVDGTHLVLASAKTGDGNDVTLTVADTGDANDTDDYGLSRLASANAAAKVTQAQDAIVVVSGYEIHSATNTVDGAIDGVTLVLKKTTAPAANPTPAQTIGLDITRDDAAIQKKAESFVAAFNTLAGQVKTLGGYDAATKTGGPLLGDSMLRGLDSQIRRMLSEPVAGASGNYTSLASLGITTTASGTLQLDSAKFKAALEADPLAVNKVFSSENGVAAKLGKYLDGKLSSTGELATRDAGITSRRKDLDRDREALEARMTVIQERYLKQFSALDGMLAQLQSTSSYLTGQLENLSKLANRDN